MRSILPFFIFEFQTALHWAAKQGSGDIVKILIEGGASVNVKSVSCATRLSSIISPPTIIAICSLEIWNVPYHIFVGQDFFPNMPYVIDSEGGWGV